MADKTSAATVGTEKSVAAVTTAGTIAAGTVNIIFDEADELSVVMDLIERAKVQIVDYYADKSS